MRVRRARKHGKPVEIVLFYIQGLEFRSAALIG
jgi:hypothetical protein